MTYNFAGAPILAALVLLSAMPAFSQSDALWTGQAQCQLTMQSPSYSYQEVQTWAINGAPSGKVSMAYPATWSVTGQGARQDLSGRQITVTQWQTSVPPMSASLAIFVNSANQLIIKSYHAQLRANGASTGLRQVTDAGVPQKPSSVSFVEFEWQFPQIEVESTRSDVSGTSSTPINSGIGPLQPPGSNGTANCSWHFSKGPTNSTHATPAIRAITGQAMEPQ